MSAMSIADRVRPGAVSDGGGVKLKGMLGSLAAEVFVLRKRVSTWVLLGIWVALAGVFAYILPYVRIAMSAAIQGRSRWMRCYRGTSSAH